MPLLLQKALTTKKKETVAFEEYSVLASICRQSFFEFVKEFWDIIISEEPVWNWHIKYLCEEIQKVAELVFRGKPKEYDLVINISPGSTKSTIASIMLPPWMWTRMPSAQIIGGSYSGELSLDLSRWGRDIILSDKYQQTFMDIKLRSDQAGKKYYMNTKGGWRYATSTGGTVTGFHGHLIIVDDPINPNEAISEVELKNANKWMTDTLSQRKVNKEVTPTILIMQRLHQNDPSADMMERARKSLSIEKLQGKTDAKLRLKHICIPAELTDKIRPRSLRKKYKNNLMDPIRQSQTVLNEARAGGEYTYAGQFLQDPVPLGGGMFKTERIKIDLPQGSKWLRRVRYWDKAGTEGGGAFTVGTLMGLYRDKRFWVLNVIRGQYSSEVREKIILQTAELDGYDVEIGIEQEPGSGGKQSAEMTVKMLAGWRVRVDKPSGSNSSKILRADPFSVQVNMGNVSMVRAEWNSAWLEEFKFFPLSRYKDQVDSGSGGFNILAVKKVRAGTMFKRVTR